MLLVGLTLHRYTETSASNQSTIDLELLAQEDGVVGAYQDGHRPRATPQGRVVSAFEHQDAPQTSRFFNRGFSMLIMLSSTELRLYS